MSAIIDTALCVGAGGSSGSLVDKPIVRNAQGQLLIPGSEIKGRLRHECEKLARALGWQIFYIYKESSFTDQIFDNIAIASCLRIQYTYPDTLAPLKIEEHNGVAIDRVFGSVAHGPFDYQVCTDGAFKIKIHLKNFSLAQLGLIALVLRDLDAGWFGIGFAKSRGLGIVRLEYNSAVVQYPGCIWHDKQIYPFSSSTPWDKVYLAGAGEFLRGDNGNPYNFLTNDQEKQEVKDILPRFCFCDRGAVSWRWGALMGIVYNNFPLLINLHRILGKSLIIQITHKSYSLKTLINMRDSLAIHPHRDNFT